MVTDDKHLFFALAYEYNDFAGTRNDPQQNFAVVENIKSNFIGRSIKEAIPSFSKVIEISSNEYLKIELKKRLGNAEIIIHTENGIQLNTRRKQFNTLKGIVSDGKTYVTAMESSGLDFARIKYYVLIVVVLIIVVLGFLYNTQSS